MAQDPESIRQIVAALVQPDARGRLLAIGLARSMVWRDGVLPEGAPDYSPRLTSDLLDFGYGLLALALELRDANENGELNPVAETQEAFRVAAEAIESAVRRGDPTDLDRGRHFVISAAAFHLAGYAARSYSLLPRQSLEQNLSSQERALALLMRRDIAVLRSVIIQWHANPSNSDDVISGRLLDENDDFDPGDASQLVLTSTYFRALGLVDSALQFGNRVYYAQSIELLTGIVRDAATLGNVPTWWSASLTLHILRDLWSQSLHVALPSGPLGDSTSSRWDELRSGFIDVLSTRRPPHIELWPSQLAAAVRSVDSTDDLVIALPTSSGKTRIAELCILRALADNRRAIYVTPLRALSAQVERVLARTFVPLGATVTSLYGASGATSSDLNSLGDASIVVATPEKLDFALRQDPNVIDDVGLIVFDEGHMIGLGSREIRYEVLIQRLLRRDDATERRIVCLSAMFNPDDPYFSDFGNWLRSDAAGESVHVQWRPTRQRFATLDWYERVGSARLGLLDGEKPYVPRFLEAVEPEGRRVNSFPQNDKEYCIACTNAFAGDGHTILVYSPQRSQIEPLAVEFHKIARQGYLTHIKPPASEHVTIAEAIGREWLGSDHAAMKALAVGVGTHHGALPRPFLNAIEELLDRRLLSVVVASPTLAQGVDLACSVLILRSIRRYEDGAWVPISAAEFSNVIGRVGRAFVDLDGLTVLPTFESGSRRALHGMFENLIEQSRGQQLLSGLAQLIFQISQRLVDKLSVPTKEFVEYVLNHGDLWEDTRLVGEQEEEDEDDDQIEDAFENQLADLDVAVLSLVEPLSVDVNDLAALLDDVLQDSLWKRTLAHQKPQIAEIERAVLHSRASWIWRTTTASQREACFFAGLGRRPGLFIYDQLDALIDVLAAFQSAVKQDDPDSAAQAAVSFAEKVIHDPQFSVRKLPDGWQSILGEWVRGTAVAELLTGRKSRDAQRVQAFLQDGVVFRLVWAAEAVRVQANAIKHARSSDLGDGPAFALTYGVPTVPAALLCQTGFASRVGAVWVTRELSASFGNTDELRDWLRDFDALLQDPAFWPSRDQYNLWTRVVAPSGYDYPRHWTRKSYRVSPSWKRDAVTGTVRIVPGPSRSATVCNVDLVPLGTVNLPFEPHQAALKAEARADSGLRIRYFGPN